MSETVNRVEEPPEIFGSNGALHPNRVGALGLGVQASAFAVESVLSTNNLVALGGLAIGGAADVADGKIAKKWPEQLKTLEGAKLDPLLDKIKTYLTAVYLAAHGANAPVLASFAFNALIDYISTTQRGSISHQVKEAIRAICKPETCTVDTQVESGTRANWAGKGKTLLQNTAGIALVGENLIREKVLPALGTDIERDLYQNINATALAVAAVLGAYGVYKKGQAKKEA